MGLTYISHKAIATFFRDIIHYKLKLDPTSDETIYIPSRDTGRTIKAHVYKPRREKQKLPGPVLINLCGSGFILRTFGSDDEFCRFIANKTDYTVIDVQYRLAPENPFPAAYNDAEDVVKWVRSLPEQFDISSISVSGFSAGANIALGLSCSSSQSALEVNTNVFRTVISFYGPVDMSVPSTQKPVADGSSFVMRKLFPIFSHLCHKCLNFTDIEAKDPRLSPIFADPSSFPKNVLIITAAQCPFALEAEKLAMNMRNAGGEHVVCRRMEDCAHGWDKEADAGTPEGKAKDEAYEMAARMLQMAGDGPQL